jgi:hypothetical protein
MFYMREPGDTIAQHCKYTKISGLPNKNRKSWLRGPIFKIPTATEKSTDLQTNSMQIYEKARTDPKLREIIEARERAPHDYANDIRPLSKPSNSEEFLGATERRTAAYLMYVRIRAPERRKNYRKDEGFERGLFHALKPRAEWKKKEKWLPVYYDLA